MHPYNFNWPSHAQRLFLQACLLPADQAQAAYRQYRSYVSYQEEESLRPFLPKLYRHFKDCQVTVPDFSFSQTDYDLARIQNRFRYQRHLDLLIRLCESGYEFLLLKGFALLHSYYGDQALRSFGDADIYVPPDQLSEMIENIKKRDGAKLFLDQPLSEIMQRNHATPFLFKDDSNLDIHWHIFWEYPSSVIDLDLWNHAEKIELKDGVFTRQLCAADHLTLLCTHGLRHNSKSPVSWILDACRLLQRNQRNFDWGRLVALSKKLQLTPVMHAALQYLRQNFLQDIPDTVLNRLQQVSLSRPDKIYLQCTHDRPRTPFQYGVFFWRQYSLRHAGKNLPAKLAGFCQYLVLELCSHQPFKTIKRFFSSGPKPGQQKKVAAAGYTPLFIDLLKKTGFKQRQFFMPGMLSFIAALLEGGVIALLVPAGRGMIQNNFDFLTASPLLKPLALLHQRLGISSPVSFFVILLALMTLLIFLKNGADYLANLRFYSNTARFKNRLRQLLFGGFLSSGKYFFDQQNAGRIHQVLMAHTQTTSQMLDFLQLSIRSFFLLVTYVGIMSVLSWQLMLAVLILFPVLHFFLKNVIAQMSRISARTVEAENHLSEKASNLFSSITLLKAHRAETGQTAIFNQMSDHCESLSFQMHRRKMAIEPIMESVSFVVYLTVAGLAGFLILPKNPAYAADFLAFIIVLRRASVSFGIFNRVRANAADTEGALREVTDYLNRPERYAVSEGTKIFETLHREIRFQHLAFHYPGGRQVLKDVHFTLSKGQMTAIVGPTGAGKTTLIHLLMRFYDCPAESILVDETDLREYTLQSFLDHVAIVEQEPPLFHDTLKQNLLFGLTHPITEDELKRVLTLAQLQELAEMLPDGLETLIGDRGVKLSGGEKQRVAIARAMLKNPDILILDEATSALDSKTESLIQRALVELIKGRTCLVIAHRLSTILQADQILVMREGSICEQGTLGELLAQKGFFFELWQHQKLMETLQES